MNMTWQIEYDGKRNLVVFFVQGQVVAADTAKMAQEGIELARKNNCDRLLIDCVQTTVQDNTLETFEFMSKLQQLGLKRTDKVASIIARDQEEHSFAETVASNRGWHNIQYFSDKSEALEWLGVTKE